MARSLIVSNTPINDSGKRIVITEKVMGITIRNKSTSDGNLLLGIGSEDCTEVLEPGQEFSIGGFAASEPYYIAPNTIFNCQWESGAVTRDASYTLVKVKDGGEIKC